MIDIDTEDLLSLAAAARTLPPLRQERPVNKATLFRWAVNGLKATDGTVVKLDAIRVGARWVTSRQALARFIQAMSERREADAEERAVVPNQNHEHDADAEERAVRELCSSK